MTTPKQRKNEEKYLEPALERLQEPYRSHFDAIYRGKKRGDGLMIDTDYKDELKGEGNTPTEWTHSYLMALIESNERNTIPAKAMMLRSNVGDETVQEHGQDVARLFSTLAAHPKAEIKQPEDVTLNDTHRPVLRSREDQMEEMKERYAFYHSELLR